MRQNYLFFFIMCSNGLRKSFWNLKLANSPFSMNLVASCLKESTAKNAMSCRGLHPTLSKWSPRTCQIRDHCSLIRPML